MLGDKFRPPAPSPSAIAQSRLVSMGTCTRLLPVRKNGMGWDLCVCVFEGYDSRFFFRQHVKRFISYQSAKYSYALILSVITSYMNMSESRWGYDEGTQNPPRGSSLNFWQSSCGGYWAKWRIYWKSEWKLVALLYMLIETSTGKKKGINSQTYYFADI